LISHVVIIVKENHTFDNYFGTFPGVNGDSTLPHAADPPVNKSGIPTDPPHNHQAWLNRAGSPGAVHQQYNEADIPAYFAYARQFTLCDNYFTQVASQSVPNHLMLVAADSPLMDNPHKNDPPQLAPPFNLPSLPASLEKAGLDWRSYGGDFVFRNLSGLIGQGKNHGSPQFTVDAAKGSLPAVSWLYSESLSEHPPHGAAPSPVVGPGMQWTVDQVNAVVQGGLWPKTVIFITWDDWGGWYDHVEPKDVEQWPANGWPASYQNTQFSYGPRVGCLVLSPFAKEGYISKAFHSHVSLVKFCETTFGLQPLNKRDAASDDISDCFDFKQQPAPPPQSVPAKGGKPAPPPPPTKPAKPRPKPTPRPKPRPKPKPRKKSRGAGAGKKRGSPSKKRRSKGKAKR
jgi:phospholipase C